MSDDTFTGLEEDTLAALRAVGRVNGYPAGHIVCRQGVVEHTFYLILDGRVEVVQQLEDGAERVLETRGKNDYFGEMGLLDARPRMANVVTLTPATLLEIAQEDLQRLLQQSPAMAQKIIRRILYILRQMDHFAMQELQEQHKELQQAYKDLQAAQEEIKAREGAKKELAIGRQIQQSFLPQTLPQPRGWQVDAHFQAARAVSGDFYDVFPLSNNRRVALVMADVCDKGVGAALFMALFRSLIRAYGEQYYSSDLLNLIMDDDPPPRGDRRKQKLPVTGTTSLRETMKMVNNYIANHHGYTNMFATIFFGLLDPVNGQLAYINGGHEPPLILGPDGRVKAELAPTGPAVGMFPDMPFQIEAVSLAPQDIFLVFTDGVTEAKSASGRIYGSERLWRAVRGDGATATAVLDRIRADLKKFTAGAEQSDDITLLAAGRL